MTKVELNLLLQVPNLVGCAGAVLAGRKRRAGWALGVAAELAWATWGYFSGTLVGLLPWCVAWGAVYARNWWKWRR